MKRILGFFTILLTTFFAQAARMNLRIINNSEFGFYRSAVEVNPEGGACNGLSNNNPQGVDHGSLDMWSQLEPGETGRFEIHEDRLICGLEGFVRWSFSENRKSYEVVISFNIPFIGGNEFNYSVSHPFAMRHLSGTGEGNDVELTFEISGGPSPLPPPLPILLPQTGNRVIKGHFTWNEHETGEPKSGTTTKLILDHVKNAFRIYATAPSELRRNKDGSGSDRFLDEKGYYDVYVKLTKVKIVFADSRDDKFKDRAPNVMSPIRTIRFTISNLPDDIPVTISVNTKDVHWSIGSKTPAKPASLANSKWMVFIHQKEKTGSSFKYEVKGAWFKSDGAYFSDSPTTLLIDQLRKNIQPPVFLGGSKDIKIMERNKTALTPGQPGIRKPTELKKLKPLKN